MSLLIYLPLNGSLTNYGYGSIGTVTDTPVWINDSPSGKGQSLDLSKRVTFSQNNSSIAGLKEFTICFWCKINAETNNTSTNWQDIIGFTDVSTSGTSGNQLRWETGYTQPGVHWHNNTGNNIYNGSRAHFSTNDGIWYHCLITKDSTGVKTYTNGELKYIDDNTSYIGQGSLLGNFWLGETNLTFGAISDVRIYDEVLNVQEISKIYQLRLNPPQGLLYWYPLINNTHNQGLITKNSINSIYASNTSDGKIGKNTYCGGHLIHLNDNEDYFDNNWTICCWFNASSFGQYNDLLLCKNNDSSNSCQWYLSIVGGNQLNCGFNGGAGGVTYNYSFQLNTWYHTAATYDGTTCKIYLNGEKVAESVSVRPKATPTPNIGIGCRSNNTTGTGFEGATTVRKIQDVRLYNVTLSPTQIMKIAQGRTIHLHLYEQFHHHSNLIKNTIFQTPQKFTLLAGSEGGFQYPLVKSLVIGQPYTISCKIRGNADMALYTLASQGNQQFPWTGLTLDPNNYQQTSLTFTPTGSGRVINTIYVCTRYGNNNPGDWFEILPSSLKVEEGSQATIYCPSYGDYNNSILQFYDGSGYCNNGIATNTNIISTINSPRYCAHSFLNLGARINLTKGFPSSVNPDCTINFWFKPNSTTTYVSYADVCGMSYTGGSGDTNCRMEVCGQTLGDAFLWFRGFLTTSGSFGYDPRTNTALNQNQWNMLTLVLDADTAKLYLNGNYLTTYTRAAETKTWKPNGDFHINETSGMAGEYSDFRIFATALSAASIQELYEMKHIST